MLQRLKDAAKALLGKPVKNAAYDVRETEARVGLLRWFDATDSDIEHALSLLSGANHKEIPPNPSEPKSVLWLLCNFTHPYGGVFTALRIADYLQDKGWKNYIAVYDNENFSIAPHMEAVSRYFPNLCEKNFGIFTGAERADIGVATFWTSAYKLIGMRTLKSLAYLIQDFEPAFYPAGTEYALCEATYKFPLHRIYNTSGLGDYIESLYSCEKVRSTYFTPAADSRYSYSPLPLTRPIRALFYARPGTPRNSYELALAFARALKACYGDTVQLVAAGEAPATHSDYATWDWAGLVPYEKLPEFYASFHIVITFMMTKHPSYLPIEAMACGCAVISNENEANSWLLKDGFNCILARPHVSALLRAFERATDETLYPELLKNGRDTVSAFNWPSQLKSIKDFLEQLC